MIEETLQLFDLSDKEILLYLTLLRVGTSSASSIANRTHINRSTAQYTCQQLSKKGFLRTIQKNNTYYYTPEPPEKLLLLVDIQKKELDRKERQVSRIIGELQNLLHPDAVMPKVMYYQGTDGLINMLEDVLKDRTIIYGALQLNSQTHTAILDYIFNDYMPRRINGVITAYMLFNDSPLTREYQKSDKKMNRKSLLLPEDDFPFAACCHIYSDKVAYYSCKKNDVTGVLIENTNIHRTALSIFQLAWNYAQMLESKNKKNIETAIK